MNYRLRIYPAIECRRLSKVFEYKTEAELLAARNTASLLLLFIQDELKVMPDYSNIFLLEEKIDGEWEEYIEEES